MPRSFLGPQLEVLLFSTCVPVSFLLAPAPRSVHIPIILDCVVAQPHRPRPFSPSGPASDEKMPALAQDPECRSWRLRSRGRLVLQKAFSFHAARMGTPQVAGPPLFARKTAALEPVLIACLCASPAMHAGCVGVDNPRSAFLHQPACKRAALLLWSGMVGSRWESGLWHDTPLVSELLYG